MARRSPATRTRQLQSGEQWSDTCISAQNRQKHLDPRLFSPRRPHHIAEKSLSVAIPSSCASTTRPGLRQGRPRSHDLPSERVPCARCCQPLPLPRASGAVSSSSPPISFVPKGAAKSTHQPARPLPAASLQHTPSTRWPAQPPPSNRPTAQTGLALLSLRLRAAQHNPPRARQTESFVGWRPSLRHSDAGQQPLLLVCQLDA